MFSTDRKDAMFPFPSELCAADVWNVSCISTENADFPDLGIGQFCPYFVPLKVNLQLDDQRSQ